MTKSEASTGSFNGNTRGKSGFEILPGTSGNFTVKVWGRFPPEWIGYLSSGLSRHKISIVKGTAKKSLAYWETEFEIEKTGLATDPRKLDFLALAKEENNTTQEISLSITSYTLEPPEKHNGALYLEIKAADQIGFLGQLLNSLAFLTLFPEEITIDTVQGKIFDKFWIKGLGGNPPSATAQAALQRKLEEWQRT
jgi:UTP:GlnB (protein PII) uridylyltransferase